MSKNLLLMIAAFMLLASPSFAQDEETRKDKPAAEKAVPDEKQEDENSPKAQLKKFQAEIETLTREFGQQARALQEKIAADGGGQEEIMEAFAGLREEMTKANVSILAKILAVADRVAEDKDAALEAAFFVLANSEDETSRLKAGNLIVEHHVDNENLPESLGQLSQGMPSKSTFDLYQRIVDKSKNRTVRGLTALAQSNFIEQLKQMSPMIKDNPQIAKLYPELVEFVNSIEEKFGDEAIMKRYEQLIADYGDVESGKMTIEKLVGRKLKAIKTRAMTAVGKVAPEIEGPDIDGNNFKLSDYRGKVVMLDFWGDW